MSFSYRASIALANALRALKRLQSKHHGVLEGSDLSNEHRLLLRDTGFLKPIVKGWYLCGDPAVQSDETWWHAHAWSFAAGYLGKRFGQRYCLNAEASLLLQTGSTAVPGQLTCVATKGGNVKVALPFSTSLLVYADPKNVPQSRVEVRGFQCWSLPEALCMVGPQFFVAYPREAEVALALVRDPAEVLPFLMEHEMVTAASRLAGAFAFTQRPDMAEAMVAAFAKARIRLKPVNPFKMAAPTLGPSRERSPYALRLRSLWASWRQEVIDAFPQPVQAGLTADTLDKIRALYVEDAFHSLSIEGYQVTEDLVRRAVRDDWDAESNTTTDDLAAHGYAMAFDAVLASLGKVLAGDDAGKVVERDHREWFAALFGPAVAAGKMERSQLIGYRKAAVFIRGSKHIPVPAEAVLDSLAALWDLIRSEPEASVRAVLGHHLFEYIHPYADGNGRMGRLLMNVLLVAGSYPWTVVRVEQRTEYMRALEAASVWENVTLLEHFLSRMQDTRRSEADVIESGDAS